MLTGACAVEVDLKPCRCTIPFSGQSMKTPGNWPDSCGIIAVITGELLMFSYAWKAFIAACSVTALISLPALAQDEKREFVGNRQCKLCHNKPAEGAQWTVWTKTEHRQAFKVLSSEKALAVGKKLGLEKPPSESASCLKCHVTGYDEKTHTVPAKLKMQEGIQCESCHGPASAHMEGGKALRMKKDTTIDISKTINWPNVETCVKCHNAENPTWDPARYTLENGETTGFDFAQAYAKIKHTNPKKAVVAKK